MRPNKDLLHLRKTLGLTQEQMSQIMGVNQPNLSAYETGATAINRVRSALIDALFFIVDQGLQDEYLETQGIGGVKKL